MRNTTLRSTGQDTPPKLGPDRFKAESGFAEANVFLLHIVLISEARGA